MRVLITGGSGFIGSHCVDEALAAGHDVRVLDNFSTSTGANLAHVASEIEIVEADVRDLDATAAAIQGSDIVYHLAALGSVPRSISDPVSTNDNNVTGTLNVLLAARDAGVGRVVFSSSSSVYGANPNLPKREEMSGDPLAPYALSKLAGEHYCRLFTELYGLDTVRVRFFNVFGPRQMADHVYAAVIPRFVQAAIDRTLIEVHGDGLQSRDFTYVRNVAGGLAKLRDAPTDAVSGQAFNMAAGRSTDLLTVLRRIGDCLGTEMAWEHVESRKGDIKNSLADNSAAARQFGYEPTIDVLEGIKLTVDYFLEMQNDRPDVAASSPVHERS